MTTTQQTFEESLALAGLSALTGPWWLMLLRGLAAITFGVLTFVWPGVSLLTLTLLWGVYALVDGVFAMAGAISGGGRDVGTRWWLAVIGLVGIAAGVVTFVWPGATTLALLIVIASWAIVVGVMQIVGGIRLRKEVSNEWLLILGGLLSIGLGVILISRPGAGALGLVWTIGAYAVIAGVMQVILAFRLKTFTNAG